MTDKYSLKQVKKNSSKHIGKESETSNHPKPITPKLPLHKTTTSETSNKDVSISQNPQSNNQNQISNTFKSTTSHNPSKKLKPPCLQSSKQKN